MISLFIQEWLTLNQLTLNNEKSSVIVLKSRKKQLKRQLNIKLNNEVLQRVGN